MGNDWLTRASCDDEAHGSAIVDVRFVMRGSSEVRREREEPQATVVVRQAAEQSDKPLLVFGANRPNMRN
jgi:hypothetical protein